MNYNELRQRGTLDFPIELYHVDKSHTRYEMAAHWHNEIEIIRILSGTLHIKLNDNLYTAKENEIIFINPETVHQATPKDCVYECIVFNPVLISGSVYGSSYFTESVKNREYIIKEHYTDKNSGVVKLVNKLFEEMFIKSSGYKFKVVGTLYNIMGEIIDHHLYHSAGGAYLSHDKNTPKLKTVLSYIRDNYSSNITLDDMASVAVMSPKYFCAFFKEKTDRTPFEYLTLYRIEKASQKLINTDLSVTSVAFSSGFNDLSYFIKTFKEIKGTTPLKYRKKAH